MYIGCEKYLIAVVIFISLIPNNIEHFSGAFFLPFAYFLFKTFVYFLKDFI